MTWTLIALQLGVILACVLTSVLDRVAARVQLKARLRMLKLEHAYQVRLATLSDRNHAVQVGTFAAVHQMHTIVKQQREEEARFIKELEARGLRVSWTKLESKGDPS